ncbi:autotransporter assembly complex protein TamA [Allorhizobium sonneratiae]|uniref:autotransporter assembly complex protein TamA n=1 Tax=Allorhizobium sonneratiae TaxID=2934936 RepID=UPI003B84515F
MRWVGAVGLAATLVAYPLHADAFSLFGITLWGKDDKTTDIIDPVHYDVTLDAGGADKALKKALENSSLLLQDKKKPVSGDLGVVIKARDDRDRLVAALYEHARYGGIVTLRVNGVDLDALPPNPSFPRNRPVPVAITVTPGPVFLFGTIRLTGDAGKLDPAHYGLIPGNPADSLTIIKAADKMVEDLKAQSRPLAHIVTRQAVADHKNNRVDVTIAIDAGPVAPLGPVTVSGAKAVNAGFIEKYSRLKPGEPYSPEAMRKATDRLRKLGTFSSVTIKPTGRLNQNGAMPVDINVSEGKFRYFGFGATYSTLDGGGLEGYWGHRNLFGSAEQLRLEGSVSGLGQNGGLGNLNYTTGITFTKPGYLTPSGTLQASLKAATLNTDPYDAKTITGKLGYSYELNDTDKVSAATALDYARIEDAFGTNKYLTFSVPLDYERDTRDDKMNPTTGYRATLSAAPSYEFLHGAAFSNFEGSISGYYGLFSDDRVVLAGKVSAGTLLGSGDLADIPATRRFFAGGGGSVRGYSYLGISPRNSNGDETGGLSYVTTSLEARIKITDEIGLVPFFDAASVSDSRLPDFSDVKAGTGLGLRYATPFGPIRLDVAVPLNPYPNGDKYGVYIGIGQSF